MFDLDELIAEIKDAFSEESSIGNEKLRQIIEEKESVDLARVFSHLPFEYSDILLELIIESGDISRVLAEMEGDRSELLSKLREKNKALLSKIFDKIDIDDIVNILGEIDEENRDWFLVCLPVRRRNKVLQLLLYKEGSAGRVMTTEFLKVKLENTVEQCFDILKTDHTAEMVYYLYVIDDSGQLSGVLSLRDILKTDNRMKVQEVMTSDVIAVNLDTDQEDVATLVERYNLAAIPVVNEKNEIQGLITVDDVIDIIRQESSEDILKLAGTSDEELLSRSPWKSFLVRVPWLLVAFFGGYLSIQSMNFFSGKISDFLVLSFVPIITGMGGNVGSQSSVIIVRGLALGNILSGSIRRILVKEITTGFLVGLLFGTLLAAVSFIQFSDALWIGMLAGCGIFFSMTISALIGALIPVVLEQCGADPAIATGPFVTVSIDNLSLLSYLGMAYFLFS